MKGHNDVVQTLLNKGVDVNAKNVYGTTALILAVQNGCTAIVQTLLDMGADVNAKDNDGNTAMKTASMYGNTETVKLFRQAGVKE